MRVLLLNYEFPPLGGGAATASAQIAMHMARSGAEVVVLTSSFKGLPRKERKDGYTIYRVPAMRRTIDRCTPPEMGAYVAGAILPALRLASSFRPDLMHVFFGVPTGAVGLAVNKFKGVPYLLSLRGGDVPGFMGKELEKLHRVTMPLTRQVWGRASVVVANSKGLRDLAQRTVPGRKIEIVPNGIDLASFRPHEESAGRNDGRVRLLFVGRLANQKGLGYLLQAIAQLSEEDRRVVELELVGSGPEDETLRSMARELGIRENVRFAGWVPRSEIVKHYQAADAFVFPSLDEGLPNVVLEAMACGKPIVATDITGNRELVQTGVNGLLVPPADPEALATALDSIMESPDMRVRMGRKSRELVGRYSWEHTASRYMELSERIVRSVHDRAVQKRKTQAVG